MVHLVLKGSGLKRFERFGPWEDVKGRPGENTQRAQFMA